MAKKNPEAEAVAAPAAVPAAPTKPPKAPKAPKAAKEPKPPKPPKPVRQLREAQNGITRPDTGTMTGRIWELSDQISTNTGKPAERKDVIAAGLAEGLNVATITTQHGRWREFHGLVTKRAPRDPSAPTTDAASATPAVGVAEPV